MHHRAVAHRPHQQNIERVGGAEMLGADRGHLDQLSFDEFDPVFLAEDADLAHPVILGNRDRAASNPGIGSQKPRVCNREHGWLDNAHE